MQRLRRFEATSLEDALEQVRQEMGADARITSAEKVRRGGVAGFFAKETFEITVETDEDAALVEAASVDGAGNATAAASAGASMAAARPVELPEFEPEPVVAVAPRTILDLADAVSAAEAAPVPVAAPVPAAAPAVPAPRVSTETESFAAVLNRLTSESSESAHSSPISTAPPPVEIPVDNVPAVVVAPARVPAIVREEAGALSRLGLPELYLPEHDGRELPARLMEALARLPQPPALPQWTGSVVAVIGPRDEALPLARELAAELGHDPKEIALASPAYRGKQIPQYLQIPTAAVAEEQRRSWRRRTTPTVVVIDAPVGGRQSPWASEVLDALEPALAWGIVDASRKVVDIAAWSRAVGGVDVLSVKRVDETVSPADILSLGIPVGRLDDEPATPARWADLLSERLAA